MVLLPPAAVKPRHPETAAATLPHDSAPCPMSSTLPPALLDAFRRTLYRVDDGPHRFIIRIGEPAPQVDALLAAHGLTSAAFLTAANPLAKPLDAAQNARRNAELRRRAEAAGARALTGEGRAEDGAWAEPSFLVLGLSRAQADALADRFEQAAYVLLEHGRPPELVLRR